MVFSREVGPLKIATFNINNINKRLDNLVTWLAKAQPDIVCLIKRIERIEKVRTRKSA
jgi:exonuclease III